MDRERKDDDTLPGSLQSLRGEYAEIQQIYRERRSDMPQAQVTMDVRKVSERHYSPTALPSTTGTSSRLFVGAPRCDPKGEQAD
jgi:hypothetical protein